MKKEILDAVLLTKFADYDAHQRVVHFQDDVTGLNAFIAVHDTGLGAALGGCRMVKYAAEAEALRDVLRLSRGMTYKNALAGLPLGGGKSVIIADPYKEKTPAMMRAMGRAIAAMDGMYITAEDSGTGESDMEQMAHEAKFVAGLPVPGSDLGGNPSPVTAYGVYCGLKAAAEKRFGTQSLHGLRVAVQGLGAVGYALCKLLYDDGVRLTATDIRDTVTAQAKLDFPGIAIVAAEEIFSVHADIFAPCAMGAQLNDKTVPLLNVGLVAGAANNQLATSGHDDMLAKRGILYAPDYALNSGGVMAVAYEYFARAGRNPFKHDLNRANLMKHVEGIGPTMNRIFNIADARKITPGAAADELAEAIFRGHHGQSRDVAC